MVGRDISRGVTAHGDDEIVVSGIGIVSPLGNDRESTWQRLIAGDIATRRLTPDDFCPLPSDPRWESCHWLGCVAAGFQNGQHDRVMEMTRRASREAIHDARLVCGAFDPARIGCVFGTSKGSLYAASELLARRKTECSPVDPWRTLMGPAIALDVAASALNAQGPRICPVAACATGLIAVLRGAELLRRRDCDIVIAGSADDSLHPLVLSSFQKMGVLATAEDARSASRPFDRHRTGFVIGTGAGCLILERRRQAIERGVDWYASLGAGQYLSDPTGMTSLDTSGEILSYLIRRCVEDSGTREIRQPDVLNLHGTATQLNDVAECRAIQKVFGAQTSAISCGSLKGALGHLLGGAGSVELALSCLMLRDQQVPPNANLDDVDPTCQLSWVRGRTLLRPIQSLLKLSLGFGGHQAALWVNRGPRHAPDPTLRST